MRALTNIMLFLVAILAVVGLYLFRQQALTGLQQKFGAALGGRTHLARQSPTPPTATAGKSSSGRAKLNSAVSSVKITVTVIPIEPKPPTDNIQIGMQKKKLWQDFGEPDAMASSREGERFLETFIYLQDPSRATVVRLVNGTVISVSATKTVGPPLLVPRVDRARKSVLLTSDSM